MTPDDPSPSPPPAPRRALALIAIAAVVAGLLAAFSWVAGWLAPARLTPKRMLDAIEANGGQAAGFRRAHAKGVCVAGQFESNGRGAALSSADILGAGSAPLLGRMSIGGASPHGSDATARVRSMALLITGRDGQEWRMAMNSFPFFGVPSVQAFHEQTLAARPDPATGKADPARQAAFAAAYPQTAAFAKWARTAPWPSSFANTDYNGIHAFRFVDAEGGSRFVRWSMRPLAPFVALDGAQREAAGPDFLARELQERLAQGPVRWEMVVTVAGPGDAVDDPSRPWPADREQVAVGTVVIDSAVAQAGGECRDINFDPLILPTGVEASADPVLAARSAVYSESFNRRQRETARGLVGEGRP